MNNLLIGILNLFIAIVIASTLWAETLGFWASTLWAFILIGNAVCAVGNVGCAYLIFKEK